MECTETIDHLSAYMDGELSDREQAEMEEHLRGCARCADEEKALRDTVALLRALPAEPAPPELLAGVRMRLGREDGAPLRSRRSFAARFRIPLQAAAAGLILLIAYGVHKQLPATAPATPRAAAVSSVKGRVGAGAAARQPAAAADAGRRVASARADAAGPRPAARSAEAPRPPAQREVASAAAPASPVDHDGSVVPAALPTGVSTVTEVEAEPANGGSTAGPQPVAAWQGSAVPVVVRPFPRGNQNIWVFATRTRSGGGAVGTAYFQESPGGDLPTVHVFTARAFRLRRPAPFGREVTVGVAADDRPGIEDRITELALRLGGTVRRQSARTASASPADAPPPPAIVQVVVPTVFADVFLEELGKLGTIPAEEMPGRLDVRPGPSPDNVAYTVQIRVR